MIVEMIWTRPLSSVRARAAATNWRHWSRRSAAFSKMTWATRRSTRTHPRRAPPATQVQGRGPKALHPISLGREDQGPLALRRELPSGKQAHVLGVARVRTSFPPTRREPLEEASDKRALSIEVEGQPGGLALPNE